jgi:hypothetical protein
VVERIDAPGGVDLGERFEPRRDLVQAPGLGADAAQLVEELDIGYRASARPIVSASRASRSPSANRPRCARALAMRCRRACIATSRSRSLPEVDNLARGVHALVAAVRSRRHDVLGAQHFERGGWVLQAPSHLDRHRERSADSSRSARRWLNAPHQLAGAERRNVGTWAGCGRAGRRGCAVTRRFAFARFWLIITNEGENARSAAEGPRAHASGVRAGSRRCSVRLTGGAAAIRFAIRSASRPTPPTVCELNACRNSRPRRWRPGSAATAPS